MKEILNKIPYTKYKEFRKVAMERLKWSGDKWANHHQMRTKLTEAERMALEEIRKEVLRSK